MFAPSKVVDIAAPVRSYHNSAPLAIAEYPLYTKNVIRIEVANSQRLHGIVAREIEQPATSAQRGVEYGYLRWAGGAAVSRLSGRNDPLLRQTMHRFSRWASDLSHGQSVPLLRGVELSVEEYRLVEKMRVASTNLSSR